MSREGEIMALHCAAHMRGACDIQSLPLHSDTRRFLFSRASSISLLYGILTNNKT